MSSWWWWAVQEEKGDLWLDRKNRGGGGKTIIKNMQHCLLYPANIASMPLVTGCPNARAGAKVVKKRGATLAQPKADPNFAHH